MNCTRRPGAVWTSCGCDSCRTLTARNSKLYRNGRRPNLDRRPAAIRRLNTWKARGYSARAIADMTGLSDRTVYPLLNGATSPAKMLHATARRILDAPDTPTGAGWVPSIGSVRRLRALTVNGWSMDALAARSDLGAATLAALRDDKHRVTRPRFAAAVARLYEELWDTPGPGKLAGARARNRGWLPPLAWDDDTIDDPDASPHVGTARARSAQETADEVEFLLRYVDSGLTAQAAGERLAVTGDAVMVALERLRDRADDDETRERAERLRARLAANGVEAGHARSIRTKAQNRRVA